MFLFGRRRQSLPVDIDVDIGDEEIAVLFTRRQSNFKGRPYTSRRRR